MKILNQSENIAVIGLEVTTFPIGIKEAFGTIMKTLGQDRAYYGISWMDDSDHVKYYAMAKEAFPGEGTLHNFERFTIQKGTYQAEALTAWQNKTDAIKDIFHRLMGNDKPNKERPCIEWYQSSEEMFCMIRAV